MIEYDKTFKGVKEIEVSLEKINKVLGINISSKEVVDIFERLNFHVNEDNNVFKVMIPPYRLDIFIKEDLIEEVGRMYGMDKIESTKLVLPLKEGKYNKDRRQIKNKMVSLGLDETLSYTLIPESEVHKFTLDNFTHINLADPMSEDRKTLRYSLLYSLKEIYEYNKARNEKDVCIFEMGKGFYKADNEYKEENKLACLMTGKYYLDINSTNVDFYIIKGVLEDLLDYMGYKGRYSIVEGNVPSEFHPGQSAVIMLQGNVVGYIGRLHPSVTKDAVYVFEINLDKVLNNKASRITFKEIPKYLKMVKDVAFVVDNNVSSREIEDVIKKAGGKLLNNIILFDLYTGNNLGENKKSIAYSLEFLDQTKTLTEEEVMEVVNKIIEAVTTKLNAKLRD